ncbi:MAG: hypothetical protein GY730_06940, partial [bacterium]|nr:hypothetical protein [bacterium]
HILRQKLAEGSLKGISSFFKILSTVWLNENLSFTAGYYNQWLDAWGKQNQTRYEKNDEGDAGPIAELDERIKSEISSIYACISYKLNGNQFFDEIYKKIDPTQKGSSFAGIAWVPPTQHQHSHPMFLAEQNITDFFRLGIGFKQTYNKVTTLISKGVMTQLPVYGLCEFKINQTFSFILGGGYIFARNHIDPQAKSDLEKEGYRQTSETTNNHWYCLTGLEYKPVPNLKWFLNYNYAKPYITFSSDIVTNKKPIDLGYISFGLKAALIDIFSFL